ncbi:MAG: LemA family protein [Clostridiales bacterium]|nr:LemA family protein [Clostridiales bacterium]
MGWFIGIGAVVLIILVWYISTLNSLNHAVVKIDEAKSGIDVALTKRFDSLTKLLDVTKGFAEHEARVISESVKFRKGMSVPQMTEAASQMSDAFTRINALAEAYPQLTSAPVFGNLQREIVDVEEHLQAARRLYNSNVSSYNMMIVTFPTSIVANGRGMTKREFFEAEAAKRSDVKMQF